ncbi:MAG: hypothetical protein NDJ72_05165 [Elusimicrobia bacterium]|nr:hypothetical protein [Elusimicrobiota bacterium]
MKRHRLRPAADPDAYTVADIPARIRHYRHKVSSATTTAQLEEALHPLRFFLAAQELEDLSAGLPDATCDAWLWVLDQKRTRN